MNQLLTGEAVLHGKAACFRYRIWVYLYYAEFQYASIMCGGSCSWWALRMSSIKLFDINLPLLSVSWRKWFDAQSASGQLAMLRGIVRQSFANRTRQALKLKAAVEQLHKATIEKNWWCGIGCMPIFFFPCLAGFQGLIPLFRFPSLASCSRQANNFCAKWATDFGKISHRLWGNEPPSLRKSKISDRLLENEPPTLGKWATDFGKMSHRLWENEPPTLGKWATKIGKISHPLWENQPPTLGKWATEFEKMSHRFWENEIRRRMEIRNRLFPKISLNKIT